MGFKTGTKFESAGPKVFTFPTWSFAWVVISFFSQLFACILSDCNNSCTYRERNSAGSYGCKQLLYGSCRTDGSMSGSIPWRNACGRCAGNFRFFEGPYLSCARSRTNRSLHYLLCRQVVDSGPFVSCQPS